MRAYLIRLRCLSPYLTPWRNCTLWGRLSWIVADRRLDGWTIDEWARRYQESNPPLVVGDAFPSDAVPVPAFFQANAKEKRPNHLPWNDWLTLCKTGRWPSEPPRPRTRRTVRMHVVMNRQLGSALDGGLRTEIGEQPDELLIVALIDDSLGETGLHSLITKLCEDGWGQGRSYGYGQIGLDSVVPLERPSEGEWMVTLGHFHSTEELPANGYWRWVGVPVRPHDRESRRGERQLFTSMLQPGSSFESSGTEAVGRVIEWAERSDYQHYGISPVWPVSGTRENAR